MKTEDTEALGKQGAKTSKIKARYSRQTCKNCSYLCAPVHNTVTQFFFHCSSSSRPNHISDVAKASVNKYRVAQIK